EASAAPIGHPSRAARGERILDYIFDDVDRTLNPDQEDCWHCGGEGYIVDCFDGCCMDADVGCEQCTSRCPECRIFEAKRKRMIREEVIKSNDVDVAVAWLKYTNRWHDDITEDQ